MDAWLDEALHAIDDQAELGICYFAFAKTIIDRPENDEKISNSYSGHAVHIQNIAVLRELQLWCCKNWEKNGFSIPQFGAKIRGRASDIEAHRRSAHPDWDDRWLGIGKVEGEIEGFCAKIVEIAESDLIARLRVRRDEQFAHILGDGKAGSRKLLKIMNVAEGYTLSEIMSLCGATFELISQAKLLLWFHSHDFLNTAEMMGKHYERYWRLLPKLSVLEQNERKSPVRQRGQ